MITFRLARHTIRPIEIVEVVRGTRVIATIVPGDSDEELRVVSAHFKDVIHLNSDERRSLGAAGLPSVVRMMFNKQEGG